MWLRDTRPLWSAGMLPNSSGQSHREDPLTPPPLRSADLSPRGEEIASAGLLPLLPAGEKVAAKRPDEGENTHDWPRYRLGPHELPTLLEPRDALPRTPVGKLSKLELKQEEAERRSAAREAS